MPKQLSNWSRQIDSGNTPRLAASARFCVASALLGVAVSYSAFYLFHLSLGLLVLLTVAEARRGLWVRHLPDNSHRFLYVMFFWYALSVAWSSNRIYSIQYLFYLFCGLAVTMAVIYLVRDERTLQRLLRIAGAIVGIEVCLSLLEAFTPFRLPVSPYSHLVHYFGRESMIEGTLEETILQSYLSSPTGFQWNPNDLAVTLVIFLPFCMFSRSVFMRGIGTLSILVVILFTGSRASYIAVALQFAMWASMFRLRRLVSVLSVMIIVVFVAPTVVAAMKASANLRIVQLAQMGAALSEYFASDSTVEDSIGIRHELVRNGLKALAESPLLGVGGGASKAVQERAGGEAARIRSMHNFWIEVVVESGLVMGSAFILWYAWMFVRCYRAAIFTRRPYLKYASSALVCSLGGFAVALVSSSSVAYLLPMWFMFGLACSALNIHVASNAGSTDCRKSSLCLEQNSLAVAADN